ncbi:hypothetical protein B0H15DRAFT_1025879 [Mycena belliarum]|uniref:Uncharacterized protein n=1 Tax=Mycena belliarum TaxID=1033014 RepID=A0AAD6XJ77_9AGAR|nr:hypothetical protein B0H15DRAFT_1025879 [Mycena belliae]
MRPARPPHAIRRAQGTRNMRRLRPPSRASNSQHPRSTPDPSAASKGAQRQALPVLRALPVASSRGSARTHALDAATPQSRVRRPTALGWSALPPRALDLRPNTLQPNCMRSRRLCIPDVYSLRPMLLACCDVAAILWAVELAVVAPARIGLERASRQRFGLPRVLVSARLGKLRRATTKRLPAKMASPPNKPVARSVEKRSSV